MAVPTEIRKLAGGDGMKLRWPDGRETEYSAHFLRTHCRCAACQHELTGERLLQPESVPTTIKIVKSEIIGQYALGFQFSDGHSTGIYTFDFIEKAQPV